MALCSGTKRCAARSKRSCREHVFGDLVAGDKGVAGRKRSSNCCYQRFHIGHVGDGTRRRFDRICAWQPDASSSSTSGFRRHLSADRNSRRSRHLAEREVQDTLDLVLWMCRRCYRSVGPGSPGRGVWAMAITLRVAVRCGRICSRDGLLADRGKACRPGSRSIRRFGVGRLMSGLRISFGV